MKEGNSIGALFQFPPLAAAIALSNRFVAE
jgi:hypothetical protein